MALTLRKRQSEFAKKLPVLLLYAHTLGYELTIGDVKANTGHSKNSCHYIQLAVDLNLFKDGKYLKDTEDHKKLGEFWESIGGSWGGRFGESKPGAGDGFDGNHYSLSWQGRK